METAFYGRMRVGRCITSDAYLTALQQVDPTSLGCSADVLAYVDRVCSGRSTCDVGVPNPEMNAFRPCSAQLTVHLEASYSCAAGKFRIGIRAAGFRIRTLDFVLVFQFFFCTLFNFNEIMDTNYR